MQRATDIHRIAFVGDYQPRKGGIATFTSDLRNAVAALGRRLECPVVAVSDRVEGYADPPEVRVEMPEAME